MDFTSWPIGGEERSRREVTETVLYCPQCRADRRAEEILGSDCALCGHKLTRITRLVTPSNEIPTEEAHDSLGLGFFEGLLDIVGGSDIRELLRASIESTELKPISNEFMKRIGRVVIDSHGGLLLDIVLRIGPYKAMLIPASFGPLPEAHNQITGTVVRGLPEYGETEFINVQEIKGQIVLLKRGKVTFFEKVKRAQDAGAIAVLVSQCYDTWPFVITESDPSANDTVKIPILMLSKEDANIIDGMLSSCVQGKVIEGEICTDTMDPLCSICHDPFDEGEKVIKLPCRHMYHEACVVSWLEKQNTCPLCRNKMPMDETKHQAGISDRRDEGNEARQPYFM